MTAGRSEHAKTLTVFLAKKRFNLTGRVPQTKEIKPNDQIEFDKSVLASQVGHSFVYNF